MTLKKKKFKIVGFLLLLTAAMFFKFGTGIESVDARPVPVARLRSLQKQVVVLERMVSDLTQRVTMIEQNAPVGVDFVTCYLKTPFDGTFFATEPTKSAAKAVVLYQCGTLSGCFENNIKCGR